MKYKTIIEVVTDAGNKNEAVEIVGEYLSGNIASGIDMRCSTKRVHPYIKSIAAVAIVSLFVLAGTLSVVLMKASHKPNSGFAVLDAVQVPLNTFPTNANSLDFKKEWENKQTKEALAHIKHVR